MRSIIQREKECYFCRALASREGNYGELTRTGLHRHHILYGAGRRKLSERYGLWIWLCPYHHQTGGMEAVHGNKSLRRHTERIAQKAFEARGGSREDWMRIFGKNYLE